MFKLFTKSLNRQFWKLEMPLPQEIPRQKTLKYETMIFFLYFNKYKKINRPVNYSAFKLEHKYINVLFPKLQLEVFFSDFGKL